MVSVSSSVSLHSNTRARRFCYHSFVTFWLRHAAAAAGSSRNSICFRTSGSVVSLFEALCLKSFIWAQHGAFPIWAHNGPCVWPHAGPVCGQFGQRVCSRKKKRPGWARYGPIMIMDSIMVPFGVPFCVHFGPIVGPSWARLRPYPGPLVGLVRPSRHLLGCLTCNFQNKNMQSAQIGPTVAPRRAPNRALRRS